MDFSNLADEIAALAHRCWCKRMLEAGWRPGKLLDPAAKTHDAIRPYQDITPEDRARMRQCVTNEPMAEWLAKSIDIVLTDRELSARDLFVGMRVRQVDGDPEEIGTVLSWTFSPSEPDLLDLITVEWRNGEVCEYSPAEHEFEPLDDLAAG